MELVALLRRHSMTEPEPNDNALRIEILAKNVGFMLFFVGGTEDGGDKYAVIVAKICVVAGFQYETTEVCGDRF